jgi:hypothetical protein
MIAWGILIGIAFTLVFEGIGAAALKWANAKFFTPKDKSA